MEAERRAEEQRLEEERRFLQDQQELLEAQEEANRVERETAEETRQLAEELYRVEKQAEALRNAMIQKSSASKAPAGKAPATRLYVVPPNWPKDVPLPPIPPPVPSQTTPGLQRGPDPPRTMPKLPAWLIRC